MTSSGIGAKPAKVQQLYEQAVAAYGPALKRLARAYESDYERRRDLLQDIHMALWESLGRFDGRCALGTWVYRVAHNTATSKCVRKRSDRVQLVSIEDIELPDRGPDRERAVDEQRALQRVIALVQQLKPLDRQVLLLYLEGLDAQDTGDVVGLSAANVATKIHRIKKILVQRFHEGGTR
jgi:RNA polymerase sigma-70 factor (ECF subfamily)